MRTKGRSRGLYKLNIIDAVSLSVSLSPENGFSININTDQIQITPTGVVISAAISKTYKVDKDRNIRISKRLLNKAFGKGSFQIKCEVDGDKIVIESE